MGKGRPRAVEKGVLTAAATASSSSTSSPTSVVPQAPVFYPNDDEFESPLDYIAKIRPIAEPFGICRIVPPKSWLPPFALDRHAFSFPTKSQAIHRLQARPPSYDLRTFQLEYSRFQEAAFGRKVARPRRVIFEGDQLDLCCLFNAVKRYGGYTKVCKEKHWADVARFVRPGQKISDCAKHVLSQLYLEHLLDFEEYEKRSEAGDWDGVKGKEGVEMETGSGKKRRKKNGGGVQRLKEAVEEKEFDQICEQCKSGLHGEVMLLCDRCDKGWHLYCLAPPLEDVPAGNWYCLECVNSDKDCFGFVQGKLCTVDEFRRIDDRMRKKWFGQSNASRVQVEKLFWEIVEGRAGEVEVMYGNDLDTSLYGSGFPRVNDTIPSSMDPNVWGHYASSPWNLNNLPKLQGSVLRAVHDSIAGVMVPWLYIGMLFSSFCWHVEDHCFYSINYLHWGEPKCWYGVPGSEANAFEQVMRKALPDLFEAQPDLLFQLVTMLNPSILQQNGVPVYGVLQEPGNFVITFPRSYHGGFNLGINCAEAVNFAPADWLPHGGVGADLYRFYRKAAVLSHEELLCVSAKNGYDPCAFQYMKQELNRMFIREKKCREELWVNGIVRSSPMAPKKHPSFVGTEEDPMCIICQQYLYLSAVTCSCRPSAFVCLEHWKHLCECNPNKHHFLYRHTLAELGDLAHMSPVHEKASGVGTLVIRQDEQCVLHNRSSIMSKQNKGRKSSFIQVAEDWLSNASHIFENPFSVSAYANALKDAEQFLWADHDMDPVRDVTNKLNEAQSWVLNVNRCLSRIESYLISKNNEKVPLFELEQLLNFHPVPCLEPGLPTIKCYVEDAQRLLAEIEFALSSPSTQIVDLELLYSRALKLPISLPSTERLLHEISSSKAWLDSVTSCLEESKPGAVDVNYLKNLKSKMLELHVNFPEKELFMTLCEEVDLWQMRCEDMLQRSFTLKELEVFLHSADNLTVSIPDIHLLRKCYQDAHSWILQLQNLTGSITLRSDYGNIVKELSRILEAGKLLKVQVDELPLAETELKRSSCREKASQVFHTMVPMQCIQQVLNEASQLGIATEKLFLNISEILERAVSWEERAKSVLKHGAPLSVFEDIIRDSKDILVSLPSVPCVEESLSYARSWLARSQPYLDRSMDNCPSGLLLKVEQLKELILQSKCLKVTLDAPKKIESTMNKIEEWEYEACSLLKHAKLLFSEQDVSSLVDNHNPTNLEELLGKIDSSVKAAQIMGFEFKELDELTCVSWFLQRCLTVLSFCNRIPSLKEVDSILEDAARFSDGFTSSPVSGELLKGTKWLRKALLVLPETRESKPSLSDVVNVLEESHNIAVTYPATVAQLQITMKKHESWLHQFHSFFGTIDEQSCPSLLKLKELGEVDALKCSEIDQVDFEVGKVESWMLQCHVILEPQTGNLGSLSAELEKIKLSLERALAIYKGSKGHKEKMCCVCCSNDSENGEFYTCLTCQDWLHFSCTDVSPLGNAGTPDGYSCSFCLCIENGVFSRTGGQTLVSRGNRPQMKSFFELLSSGGNLFKGLPEVNMVEEIVQQALQCSSYLTDIANQAVSHCEQDLGCVSESLVTALKVVAVSGIYDHQVSCNLKSAVSRNSWKIRVRKLLGGSKKPVIQQIQRLIKEGLAFSITSEDYFMRKIAKAQEISLHWVEIAKKVASDGGELPLSEVYKLIKDGENLPVQFDKELESLRARSVLYCICRKPYDKRAMIACDQCDEWYHFDCINMCTPPPKTFYCPACQPATGESVSLPHPICAEGRSNTECEPRTPPAFHNESKWRLPRKIESCSQNKLQNRVDLIDILRSSSDLEQLWREKKRSLQRTAKRRSKLEGSS